MDGGHFTTPCLAERRCDRYGIGFAEHFRYHYVLSGEAFRSYPGWHRHTIGRTTLHVGDALPVAEVTDIDGTPVGWILGIATHPDHGVITSLRIEAKALSASFVADFEAAVTDFAGRYVAVLTTRHLRRVYGDPTGDLPVIFDPDTGRVGSSLGVVLDRSVSMAAGPGAKRILRHRRHVAFGRTIDDRARYCLPNHYLDLDSCETVRFWPAEDLPFDVLRAETDAVTDQIIERLRFNIDVLSSNFDAIMPLTGGRDSRIMLACILPDASSVTAFVCHRFNGMSRRDAKTAKAIADHLSLPFQQFYKKERTTADSRDLRLRMGWSGARGEAQAIASMNDYPADHLVLRGQIMEVLRGTQWQDGAFRKSTGAAHLLSKAGVLEPDATPETRAAALTEMESWLADLPERARYRAPDLAWIEFKLSHYQGGYFMGFHRSFFINPFNDRHLIYRGIALRPSLRKGGHIVRDILRRTAPELLEFPFN